MRRAARQRSARPSTAWVLRRSVFWIRCTAQGLHPRSVLKYRLGRLDDFRWRGHRLRGPDMEVLWDHAAPIVAGEYDIDGFAPEPGERVVDVGANVGVYALFAADRGATVEAYEPQPELFEWLCRNTATESVTAHRAAVVANAANGATAKLWIHPTRNIRTTLLGRDVYTGESLEQAIEVPAVSLEQAVGNWCDLLKLDCEGGEFDLILHSPAPALQRVRRLVVEVHNSIGEVADLADRLRAL